MYVAQKYIAKYVQNDETELAIAKRHVLRYGVYQ